MTAKKQRFVGFWAQDEQIKKLDDLAKMTRRSKSAILRILIDAAEAEAPDIRLAVDGRGGRNA